MNHILHASIIFFCLVGALPAEEYRDVMAVQSVLKLHTENYGAVGDKDNLNSIIIHGQQTQDGLTGRITTHKKRPNLMRFRLEAGGVTVTTTCDGQKAWLETRESAQVRHRDLSGRELIEVQREARFEGPLYRSLTKSKTTVSFAGKDRSGDIEVIVLRVQKSGSTDSLHYLDVKTAYVHRVDRLNEYGEVVLQTLFRDYRLVDGYPFAHEVESRVAGELVSLTKIDSIVINPGILSLFFSYPIKDHD